MKLDVRHPLPLWRKLRLENKILLLFACLMALAGAIVLFTQYRLTRSAAREIVLQHVGAGLADSLAPMAAAVENGDERVLESLLKRAAVRDDRIAYLNVSDDQGRSLASWVETVLAGEQPSSGPAADVSREVADRGGERVHVERTFRLAKNGRRLGLLTVGVDKRHIDVPASRLVASVGVALAGSFVLVILLARIAVRKGVNRVLKLTGVAEEISVGNLNPRIDFGVRVNCWEIKNCQRTECKAYMNLTKQCWYIDGTPCEGYEPRFPQKLEGCRKCEVYQLHRGDEIVQLADALRHMTDVLKDSREQLVSSDDFQKRLIRNSFDGIVATDANDVITIFNRVAEDLLGASRESVIGSRDWKAFFEDELEKCMDLPLSHEPIRRVRGFPTRESRIRREDGKLIDVLLSGISLFERGRHLGKVFFFRDMREVKRLREDLIRSERLAATGQAAAGISHSIKNILDGFAGGAYVFKQGKRNTDQAKMDTGWDMIERNIEIISSLVKDLLSFSKERRPVYESIDPASLIGDVLSRVTFRDRDRVAVRLEIDEDCPSVELDAHAFHQCLANLVLNAFEAIPPDRSGTVTIGADVQEGKATFTVSDDGVGMSPETLEKVKGGMYSTKGSKGTGLGLLVVQKIVREHKGVLTIDSAEGKGSTFRIELPAGGVPVAA